MRTVIAVFPGEMTVALLQFHHGIEQGAHLCFPVFMHTAVLALIVQVVEHGIHGFRLLAYAVCDVVVGGYSACDVHVFLEIAVGSEPIGQPTVIDVVAHLDELCVTGLLSIFQGIEGIEEHTPAET